MATGKASRNRTIGIAFAFGLVRLLPAVSTTFTGTGLWTDVTKWNNGVPQAGDTAIIDNNGSVTLDGITVNAWSIQPKNNTSIIVNNSDVTLAASATSGDNKASCLALGDSANCNVTMTVTDSNITQYESYVGRASGGSVRYSQTGGTFTSTNLWDVQGYSPVEMSFDGVDASFQGWRLVVGRSANTCRVSFANGTFTNSASLSVLMGISDYAGGHIAFNNEDVNIGGTRWWCGYSNKQAVKPALVTLEDSRVRQSSGAQVNVGISGDGNNAAKGLLVATDCVWTNASGRSVFVGGGNVPGSAGHVILSNCVYKTEGTTQNGYSFVLGQTSGTTGRLDIVRGTFDSDTAGGFNTSKVSVGAAAGAIGILALHGRNLTSFPSFSFTEGSDSTIELVDGTYFKDSALTIGSERKNGFSRFHVRGGSFSIGTSKNLIAGSNNPTDGGTGEGEIVADGSAITCYYFVAGRNSNHPGHILLRNGAVVNCNKLYSGYEGTSVGFLTNLGAIVKTTQVYIGSPGAGPAGATGYYKDGEGSSTVTADFRAPHCGTAYAEIGGTVRGSRFFVGISDNFTGTVAVVDGAFVDITNNFCVGVKNCAGVAKLELKGGTVCMPRVQFHNENNARVSNMSASIYFNGGTLRARQNQTSNWIASDFTATAVSDGGAVFDSNGYSVSSAAPLTHDARAGAAAKDGGVTKKGEGTVKLTGALSFNGDIRVEAGTLDLSSATFSMGPSAGLSGSGTLKTPAGGLAVGGAVRLDAARGTLTVVGDVTFGATATIEVDDLESLSQDRFYTLLTASSITGLPALSPDLPRGWKVFSLGNELRLGYASGTTILFR